MDNLYIKSFLSPIGPISIKASTKGITSVQFGTEDIADNPSHQILYCIEQLQEYFSGKRQNFDLILDFNGHTEFHKNVWHELLKIPFGKTYSYMDIALKLNNPGAIRAVGRANGANPIAIVVPCHRVIGSNGSLTGYASGIEKKQYLLSLENPRCFGMQKSLF